MTQLASDHQQPGLEEVLTWLDDLTHRMSTLDAAGAHVTPGAGSFHVTEGERTVLSEG